MENKTKATYKWEDLLPGMIGILKTGSPEMIENVTKDLFKMAKDVDKLNSGFEII